MGTVRYSASALALALAVIGAGCGSSKPALRQPVPCPASVPPTPAATDAAKTPLASAWPGFLRDARHSAQSEAVGPQTGAVRWTRMLERSVTTGPVVAADGTVYVASNGGKPSSR